MSNEDQIEELKQLIAEEKELKKRKRAPEYYQAVNKRRAERDPTVWNKKYERSKETGQYDKQLERQREFKRTLRNDPVERKKLSDQVTELRNRKQEQAAGRPRPNTCEICSEPGRISFDHCHNSGKFRGWLCVRCNLILGHAKDNPVLLEKLAVYVRTHDA
jgi:hypothetical protein